MKVLFLSFCEIGMILGTVPALAACTPIPGADQIWSRPSVHWVFVGELHGSNEAPAAFLDLVCDALARGRSVTVALERPESEQAALDEILASKNLTAATDALLAQHDWRDGMDGRASEAMLQLLLALRDLHHTYPSLNVVAFDAPPAGDAPGARDEAMGRALLAMGKVESRNLILVLTGNVHGMQAPIFGYDFAAMYLPPEQRLSLEVTDEGGRSWSDSNGGCGAMDGGVGDKGANRPRGIYLEPALAPYGKVDGVLALGVPLTASAPAAGEPSPLPACRVKFLQQVHSSSALVPK
jgi:hypothetical protein